jgi:phosphohistidine swiveling domain-containing protein
MNVILVSGRYPTSAASSARHEQDAKFAADLAASGCDVRWVVPTLADAPPVADGANVIPVRSRAPGFQAVESCLLDRFTEASLAREIRRELPAVVHLLDYGGSVSVNASWVASRLGVPVVVSASAGTILCHRKTLIHVDGSECEEWADARRCADCYLEPSAPGLSPGASRLGRLLIAVRWPFHAYATSTTFENRLELVAGGLQSADVIVVESPVDRDRLGSLGVREDQLRLLAAPGIEDWRRVYSDLLRT